MFTVTFTSGAHEAIQAVAAQRGYERAGLLIRRQAPKGEVTRTVAGEVQWEVERPSSSWRAQVGEFATFQHEESPDLVTFESVPVWLAFTPGQGESGVNVSLRDGELRVSSHDA